MTLGKSFNLSELPSPHVFNEDIKTHLTGLSRGFKIVYVKCFCSVESSLIKPDCWKEVEIGLYLGMAEEKKRAE